MNNNLDDQSFEKVLMILACVGLFFLLVTIKPPVEIEHTSTQQHIEKIIDLKQQLSSNTSQSENILDSFKWGWRSWRQVQCLADNIYYESRGEPLEGQIAVGIVTLNRVKDSRWASDICDVVKQKTLVRYFDDSEYKLKSICQFSWYCDGSAHARVNQKEWDKIVELSVRLLYTNKYNYMATTYQNAYYFHSVSVDPAWASRVKLIKQTGNHLFYGDI